MFEVVSCSWKSSPVERIYTCKENNGKHLICGVTKRNIFFSHVVSWNRKRIRWLQPAETLSGREGTTGCNSTCNHGRNSLLICSMGSGRH